MSKDTIYREDAIKAFIVNNKGKRIPYVDCDNFPIEFPLEYIVKTIKELPSADKSGEWITVWDECGENENGYKCSECGAEVDEKFPNCPYCLARMKGADDDRA